MKLHWSISNLIVGTIITMMLSSTFALAQNTPTNRLISASISTLNRRELHRVPPAGDFYTLADKMDAATEASSRDGSLLLEEHRIWENSKKIVEQAPDRHAIYQRLRARGWKGSWEDTEKMASATREDRYKAVREIQEYGLRVYQHGLSEGVLLRPLGNVVYFMPPYVITEDEIALLARVACAGIDLAVR